jgi:Skp family chaperone for outer membrane proteins
MAELSALARPLATAQGIDRSSIFCEAKDMHPLPLVLVFLLLGLTDMRAAAPTPVRIAVVDLTAVFQAHPRTARETETLGNARNAARKNFRAKSADLKNILQRHQELLRAGNKAEAAATLEKANEIERAIAELGTTNQRNLEEQFRRAKEEIMADIARVVREFNATEGYSVVLDKTATSANGLPQVLDAPGADDITAEIIARVKQ